MAHDEHSAPVSFIGLGAMGLPMVRQLLAAGFQVSCYDVSNPRLELAAGAGAISNSSPYEAAAPADTTFLMVANADQVEEVVFGPNGVQEAQDESSTLCVMSTVGPKCVASLSHRLEDKGVAVLDAPVSGGVVRAETGELVIMVGGDSGVLTAHDSLLKAMGSAIIHCGPRPGDGQAVKLVNQLLAGVHIAAAAEALTYSRALGLDPRVVFEVVSRGAADSFMLSNRGPRMLNLDFDEPQSALDIFVKDMTLVSQEASARNFPIPLAAVAHGLYLMGASKGLGQKDDSSLIALYDEWITTTPTRP